MEQLNNILLELGISKVRLAKYLGVSRQMVYNYLELPNLSKWPKEKKISLFKLLDIEDGDNETLENIKINTEYLLAVTERLNKGLKDNVQGEFLDLKGLKKEEQQLIGDITYLIKDKLVDTQEHEENYYALLYLYHLLQSLDNVPEIRYLLAYMSKATGFTKPHEFKFNEDKQFMFEGIIHSAFSLYSSGGASKNKVVESHKRFVQEIETRTEERLSRTQQLNSVKIQALRELGYNDINQDNATEVLEKMAEIETRRA
ncbi:MAG: hypothetical protein PHH51_01630 [Bacilli bacterium]|nr:hypothetical protein [Bacilli bacterium]MDD3895485.1 hypothetical protein [Bacilli bacterium]MDD4407426.1 hypothetical protein [Bacilli bacterium]